MRKISQSEVNTYNQCHKKHQFAFINKLEAKKKSTAITKGVAGHKFLEVFLQTQDREAALTEAMAVDMTAAADIAPLVMTWVDEIWPKLGWTVIETEKTYSVPVGDGLEFPFTCDALVENRQGQLVIVDHKFIGDFYSEKTIQISKQLPLYIGAMRMLDIPVHHAQYNFIRTRPNAVERYDQPLVTPSDEVIKQLMTDQIESMEEINVAYDRPVKTISRAAEPWTCKTCPFIDLCIESLNGRDSTLTLRADFQRNSYGY